MTGSGAGRPERLGRLLLALLLAYLAVNLWAAWPFTTDDAYITLRYARHLASGAGLLWNPGEPPVEGYSSFSFLLLGAAALALGLEPVTLLKLVGTASALGAAGLLYKLARLWLPPVAACAAPLVFTLLRGTSWWAVSGLETTFYVAASLAAILVFFDAWESRRPARLAAAGLLAVVPALTRPEGPLVAGCLGLYGLLALRRAAVQEAGGAGLRRLLVFGAAFALPFAAYQAGRLAYYGRLLPNSAYCKIVSGVESRLLLEYLAVGWPLMALALFALLARRPVDLRLLALAAIGVLYAALVRDVVPVVAYHHRHVLLALAAWCVPAAVGLEAVSRRLETRLPRRMRGEVVRLVALALVALGLGLSERSVPPTIRTQAEAMADRIRVREEIAGWLAERLAPGELVATPDAGVVPYRLANPVLDTMCLNCRVATRPPISLQPVPYAAYVLDRAPRFVVVYVGDSGRFRSGAVLDVLDQTPDFARGYRRVAFFDTAVPDFNFAVFERLAEERR